MKFNQSLLPFQAEFTAENRETRVTANTISEDVGSRWPLKLRRRFDSSSVMCRESHGDKKPSPKSPAWSVFLLWQTMPGATQGDSDHDNNKLRS